MSEHKIGNYVIKDFIAEGSFGQVYLAYDEVYQREVAIKRISKDQGQKIDQEVAVMQSLKHPHIVQLYNLIEDQDDYLLVMELIKGGELLDRIERKQRYSEAETQEVMRQLFQVLDYLHAQGYVHRDIKPENIFLVSPDNDTQIKVGDLGIVCNLTKQVTATGSPLYLPPEITNQILDNEQVICDATHDLWSAGVLMYYLLSGIYPITGSNVFQILFRIRLVNKTGISFPKEYFQGVSSEAIDLIKQLLTYDPNQRITVDQAQNHPWFSRTIFASREPFPIHGTLTEETESLRSEGFDSLSLIPSEITGTIIIQEDPEQLTGTVIITPEVDLKVRKTRKIKSITPKLLTSIKQVQKLEQKVLKPQAKAETIKHLKYLASTHSKVSAQIQELSKEQLQTLTPELRKSITLKPQMIQPKISITKPTHQKIEQTINKLERLERAEEQLINATVKDDQQLVEVMKHQSDLEHLTAELNEQELDLLQRSMHKIKSLPKKSISKVPKRRVKTVKRSRPSVKDKPIRLRKSKDGAYYVTKSGKKILNPWIAYAFKYAKKHQITFCEAINQGAESYHQLYG